MRVHEILTEARSHPDLNKKVHPLQTLKDMFDKTTDVIGGTRNLFVSLTTVNKLGIYPDSTSITPNGIYVWPAEFLLRWAMEVNDNGMSPYSKTPFINIFKLQGNIVDLADDAACNKHIAILDNLLKHQPIEAQREIAYQVHQSNPSSSGQLLYMKTMHAAPLFFPDATYGKGWAHMFRKLGVDGIMDNGNGIIYKKDIEMTQGVIFHTGAVLNKQHVTLLNPATPKDEVPDKVTQQNYRDMVSGLDLDTVSPYNPNWYKNQ